MTGPEPAGLARRLAANTMHAASGRVASLLLWLALTPPLYRALGPEGFGVWSLFYALTGYLGALDFGLAPATMRHVSAARARGDDAEAGAYATVSVLGYAALGLLWLALMPLVRGPLLEFLRVPDEVRPAANFAFTAGAVVFAMAGATNTIVYVLQGYDRFDLGNATMLTVAVVQAIGLLITLLRDWGLPGVVCATAVGWTAAAIVGLVLVHTGAPAFRWSSPRGAKGVVRATLGYGAPLQLANLLAVAHQQLDKLLLSRYVALAAVAPYELGLRVSTALATFPQLLMLALVPPATRLHTTGDHALLAELYRRSNRYILLAAVTVGAGAVAGADRAFEAWLGHADAPAALALRGLMLAACTGLGAGMATVTARGMGRPDLEAEFSAVALAVHLALGLPLVRTYGMTGVIAALGAGNALGVVWFVFRLAGALGWSRARTLLDGAVVPVIAFVAGTGAGLWIDRVIPVATGAAAWPGLVLVGGVASALTAAVALAARYVSTDELRRLARPVEAPR